MQKLKYSNETIVKTVSLVLTAYETFDGGKQHDQFNLYKQALFSVEKLLRHNKLIFRPR